MDIKLRYKEGKAMAVTDSGEARIIKLVLKDQFLEIMEKLNPSKLDDVGKIQEMVTKQKFATESSFTFSKLSVERTVEILMDEENPSLGISVKGGTDFNLPILISRIIPGERADKTNRLFVGDAILELNGKSMLSLTHKEAVDALLSAGLHVTLQVRHLPHAATVLLNEGVFKKQLSVTEENKQTEQNPYRSKENNGISNVLRAITGSSHINDESDLDGSNENIHQLPSEEYSYLVNNSATRKTKGDSKNWVIGLRVSLQYAYLSIFQYQRSNNVETLNSFIVRSIEGHSTGIISFKDPNQFHYWKEAIKFNINSLLINNIKKFNQSSSKDNQVHYMGWIYFLGQSNEDILKTCKSYHESEYANIETLTQEMKATVMKNGKNQCISRKEKSLDNSPTLKWCYLTVKNDQKYHATTPVKLKISSYPEQHSLEREPSHQRSASSRDKKYSIIDKPLFIILRGIYIFIFNKPPTSLGDWFTPLKRYLISRAMIVYRKKCADQGEINHLDAAISSGNLAMSESHISQNSYKDKELSPTKFVLQIELTEFECIMDSLADLYELEKIWIRVNYFAVCQMRMDSFKCIYQNIDCILCLDFDYGLKLINAADGIKIWQFKFHHLRASSDDGENRLRLIFTDHINPQTRIDQVLHCHNLATLLISIQSFLTAKLGQVDPRYFDI